MPTIGRTANYDEMLTRIFVGTFLSSLLTTTLLRLAIPEIDGFLDPLDKLPAIGPLKDLEKIKMGSLVCSAIISLLFRLLQMHNIISDIFRIREYFDYHFIIVPMARELDISFSLTQKTRFKLKRCELMRKIFYQYASSTEPAIDAHLVRNALDKWTWVWIGIEGALVFVMGLLLAAIFKEWHAASLMILLCMLALVISLFFINWACVPAADSQIREILRDKERATQIRGELHAL